MRHRCVCDGDLILGGSIKRRCDSVWWIDGGFTCDEFKTNMQNYTLHFLWQNSRYICINFLLLLTQFKIYFSFFNLKKYYFHKFCFFFFNFVNFILFFLLHVIIIFIYQIIIPFAFFWNKSECRFFHVINVFTQYL